MKPNSQMDAANVPEALKAIASISRSTKLLQEALNGRLSIADNLNAAVIQVDCVHNSEASVPANILRGRPAFFQPLYTTVSRTDTTPALPVACTPRPLNYSRTDGYVGLTLQYQVSTQAEQQQSFLPFASALSPATNTSTTIGTVSLSAGVWELTGVGMISGTLTGTRNSLSIDAAGATSFDTPNEGNSFVDSPTMPTAASDQTLTIPQLRVSITSDTVYGLFGRVLYTAGTLKMWGRISAVKVAPSTTYAATVTGILWGG